MELKYARSGSAHIAYRVEGTGPAMIELSAFTISIDAIDDEPHSHRYYERLRSFARLVQLDARGVGLSDPLDPAAELSARTTAIDALAVLDAVGAETTFVLATNGTGAMAAELAVLAPERVTGVVFISSYARLTRDLDYDIGLPQYVVERFVTDNVDPDASWQSSAGDDDVSLIAPSLKDDMQFRAWWTRSSRRAASPYSAQARLLVNATADARALLPHITAPALVLHRRDDQFVPVGVGRYVAEQLPNARYVELDGADNLPYSGDVDALLDEIELFVTGAVEHAAAERVLATVLFTDIVESTTRAAELGDRRWREQLDSHDGLVREQLKRFGGREVNTTGDGFFAAFDSPTQAVRCASAIVAASARAALSVRAGLHTGECERRGNDLAGLAVHIAARVAAAAPADRVLVTRTVRDLTTGADLRFESFGEHELKGVPDPWELFEVTQP